MNEYSNLLASLEHLATSSSRGMIARARLAAPGLNRVLMRELGPSHGRKGVLIAEPIIEAAKAWETDPSCLGDLQPALLDPTLVNALDAQGPSRMPRERFPFSHQIAAWRETLERNKSVLVTAGTGAGKTECFLVPILQDCLAQARPGRGVRALLIYPLNALIESQRERLGAWIRGLDGRVRFALLNGDTPDTEREAKIKSDRYELRSRESIRKNPPEILVTNVTMLEYMLLRGADQNLLRASQGALRWVVLDEAHSYAGSQAAEMALLLRRVRSGFGVRADAVRLVATSATIGGETRAQEKLASFAAALAGQDLGNIAVIEGRERAVNLPQPSADSELDAAALQSLSPDELGAQLAPHPRIQTLRTALSRSGLPLSKIAELLTGDREKKDDAGLLIDLCGRARWQGRPLLPWRAHVFHRAQGGVWACPDPVCSQRASELKQEGSGWAFGATYVVPRAKCDCGAPVYEVVSCTECGTPHLQGVLTQGGQPRLDPPDPGEGDDFALDAEPDDDDVRNEPTTTGWLAAPGQQGGDSGWLAIDGRWFDNQPAKSAARAYALRLVTDPSLRGCCAQAGRAGLMGLHFGPNFLIGNGVVALLGGLTSPDGRPGLPLGGRRAISFSDSRQGVARLAAKLQQGSERELTRAFLWHAVQEGTKPDATPEVIAALKHKIERMEAVGLSDLAKSDRDELKRLTDASPIQIPWRALVDHFAAQSDLKQFAGVIWRGRSTGREMADDPQKIAEMFLYRELFRRPRIQNNPETLGLLRLSFPALESRARQGQIPQPLREAGLDGAAYAGLAQASLDMIFRQSLAVQMPEWMVRLVAPRYGKLNSIVANGTRPEDTPPACRRWPGPIPFKGRLTKLAEVVYALIGGSPEDRADQDRAGDVLESLWNLVATTVAPSIGGVEHRLDFSRASVLRLDRAFLCPVVRRPYGYSLGGRSPNDPNLAMEPIDYPRLPIANRGGLTRDQEVQANSWCETDRNVQALRDRGLWTNLHDRLAAYPRYVRAQEHSAQIPRPVLQRYEEDFAAGRINLLNCSTTMEMGVDLADVRLVVNANVPPALPNYRQRAGRAGRRGEPWAFTVTFCRDLPLDRRCFEDPLAYLARPIVAPMVWFDSDALVQRHVNAALLAAWLSEKGGTKVTGAIGTFLGAGQSAEKPVEDGAPCDSFLADLDAGWADKNKDAVSTIVKGTILADQSASALAARTRTAFEELVREWRIEHRTLLDAAAGKASDQDTRRALEFRAKRLAGEFLLGELARRGFTPAYGFPTDVVTFENLRHRSDDEGSRASHFKRGTASRPLDQAIREYAPGAEVVIDGLVHRSEGILPAWEAGADATGLEDLRTLWTCSSCHAFEWSTTTPATCPHCGHDALDFQRTLRPAGFLGAEPAHVGYENLSHVSSDPIRLSAHRGDWVALPEGAGRMRADRGGRVAVSTAGPGGGGFAVCLDCGRAHPMDRPQDGIPAVLPRPMHRHPPLLLRRGLARTRDGLCPASDAQHRIQRSIHLAQVKRTDVWQWELPEAATEGSARAFAAALREALAERLGVEAAEISPSANEATDPSGRATVSVFLHDIAAGGAGLTTRMAEPEMLSAALARATQLLDCPAACRRGCPACILRPDLNARALQLDRVGALDLAKTLGSLINLPERLRVFGADTRLAGRPAARHLATRLRQGELLAADLWLHGDPENWHLADWPARRVLNRLAEEGIRPRIGLAARALTAAGLTLDRKLALHALAQVADLHLVPELPEVAGQPVLMQLQLHGGRTEAFAVGSIEEAVPAPGWGLGAAAPALVGSHAPQQPGRALSTGRLVELGTGNARLLWPKDALDGPAAGFGKRFWDWLKQEVALEVGAMVSVGVKSLHYTDRYLIQAYTLRCLADVVRAAPGMKDAPVTVDIAPDDRPPMDTRLVHHGFPTSAMRLDVLKCLMPDAQIRPKHKSDMPHYRAFSIELRDGRTIEILLDQGFGMWRVKSSVRHDFTAPSVAQAKALQRAEFRVEADRLRVPLAVTIR